VTIGMLATPPVATRRTQSWLQATWRLALWDLFLAWRRTMSKVLLGLLLGPYALMLIVIVLVYADAAISRADGAAAIRDAVTFPLALAGPGYLLRLLGPFLTAILAGAVVGGEYGFGTHRLSLSRGMSRWQVHAAQVMALALIALITAGGMLVIASVFGVTLGPALGSDLIIPLPDGWLHLALFWLALSLNLWGYMLAALFFATLGRSAASGIGGALGLLIVEFVLNGVLLVISAVLLSLRRDGAASIVQAIPQLFLGNALGTLVDRAGAGPIHLTSAPGEALWLAFIVVLVYCSGLIAGSYLLFRVRDVTD
jgi:ABC-2 type transport system permease protein